MTSYVRTVHKLIPVTRMRLVGREKEPLDLTQDKYHEIFQNSFAQWVKEMGESKDGSKYGFADIIGADLQPYGTPYASA